MPVFIESLIEVLVKYWKVILPALVIAIAVPLIYYKGYSNASKKCEASKYQAAYEQQVEQNKALLKENADLKAKQGKNHVVVETQIKEVPKYVQDNRACDLSPDAIGLLNNARNLSPKP